MNSENKNLKITEPTETSEGVWESPENPSDCEAQNKTGAPCGDLAICVHCKHA